MTPFDRASLSLSGAELPPPTVGGSPLISGGHVASSSGDGFLVACASAIFAAATLMNVAMIRMVGRKGNSSRTCGACYSTRGRVKCSRNVVAEGQGDLGEIGWSRIPIVRTRLVNACP
jgi:hypothetical protein